MIDPHHSLLFGVDLTFNALSFTSCLWLLFTYSQTQEFSSAQFRMATNIAVSDLIIAITGFLAYLIDHNDSFYIINSFLALVAIWSSAYWTSTTGVLQYKKISKERGFNSGKFYDKSRKVWAVLCLAVPLIISIVLYGLDIDYSVSDYRFNKVPNIVTYTPVFLLIEALPLIVSITVTFISYMKQIKILKEFELFDMDINLSKLLKYPIAQSFIFLPSLGCKFFYIASPYTNVGFTAIRMFGYYLSGLINSFVYKIQTAEQQSEKSSIITPKVFPSVYDSRRQTMLESDGEKQSDDDYADL